GCSEGGEGEPGEGQIERVVGDPGWDEAGHCGDIFTTVAAEEAAGGEHDPDDSRAEAVEPWGADREGEADHAGQEVESVLPAVDIEEAEGLLGDKAVPGGKA